MVQEEAERLTNGPIAISRSGYEENDVADDAPKAKMNTDMVRAISVLLVIPNVAAISALPGAIIDEETGDTNVNRETMNVERHRFAGVQLGQP